jgi:UMF1 family MFS transporter
LYDWANSAFVTTVVTAVFPTYFSRVAAVDLPPVVATARFAMATTVSLTLMALAAPFLGALADVARVKKALLGAFLILGVGATAGMSFIQRGEWRSAAVLFMLADIGAAGSFVFYDALLPHIARREELDRVSTTGYALGYLGGGLLLGINLLWITFPAWFGLRDAETGARVSFLSVAVWWLVFSIPLFRQIAEPHSAGFPAVRRDQIIRRTLTQLRNTYTTLRRYKPALLFLVAFLLYNDGIGTIIRMAVVYGTEIGLPQESLIAAILMVQFVGVPFAFLFGRLAHYLGAKRAIFLALAVYVAVAMIGYYMHTAWQFYLLAFLVGTVQGGSQALSRSLFASMVPQTQSAEFFAFFAVTEKFAGIFGPAIFALMATLSGSSRSAILAVIGFFIAGGVILARVDVAEGQRMAGESG